MKSKKIMALIIAFFIISPSALAYANPVPDNPNKTIEEKHKEISDREKAIEEQKKALEESKNSLEERNKEIQEIQREIALNEQKIDELEVQIQQLNNEISDIMLKLDELKEQISAVRIELSEAIEKHNIIVKANEGRLRELYKNGYKSSILNLLMKSQSFKDFFDNIIISSKIVAFDNNLLNTVNKAKEAIEQKEIELKVLQEEIEAELNTLEYKKASVETVQADYERARTQAEYSKAQAELAKDEAYQQMSSVERAIAAEERAKKNAENELINYERSLFASLNNIAKTTTSKSQLESSIEGMRAVRKQLTTSTADKEIVDAIEAAKVRLATWQPAPTPPPSGGNDSGSPGNSDSLSAKREQIVMAAHKLLGVDYVWGGESFEEGGFDCSGLVYYVYRQFGYKVTRTTYTQIKDGIEVSYNDLLPGDLVFPHDGHVGIYIGGGKYIEAPKPGEKIRISPIRFWRARRIIY